MQTKRCPACKTTLAVEAFNKNKAESDGLQSYCRACSKVLRAEADKRKKSSPVTPQIEGTKQCPGCLVEKNITEFYVNRLSLDGRASCCSECSRARTKISNAKRPKEETAAVKHEWYLLNREKSIARSTKYAKDHPEWAREMSRKNRINNPWKEKYPEKAAEKARRDAVAYRFRKHGITHEEYDLMLAAQNYVCAVCKEVPKSAPVREGAVVFDNFVIDHDHQTDKVRGLLCTQCNVALGMIRDNPNTARNMISYLENGGHSAQYSQLELGLEVHDTDLVPCVKGDEQPFLDFHKENNFIWH